jgi:transcriptional regulator with AAA-type ATPase domain
LTRERSTIDSASVEDGGVETIERPVPALMIAWSRDEPHRAGEVVLFEVDGAAQIFGRGEASGAGRAVLRRQRPGGEVIAPPLESPALSREQLRITAKRGVLHVERVGRIKAVFRGDVVDRCSLRPGDTLLLKGQLLLYCLTRPRALPPLRELPASSCGGFGEPDAFGLLGESPAIWRLRDTIAFHAKAGAHTLVLGPSGAGKEICARSLHLLSSRARGPFVARNAATLPPGLVDAELFGNTKNYPNPGMPERPGLVGAADGGTLFLDEIGELPSSVHANLLRVLDDGGEYHRLGETRPRRASLRLVAATNRPPSALKHDLLARLTLRVAVPGLGERRDDIPLLIRHLLRNAQAKSPEIVGRFSEKNGEVRTSPDLVEHLIGRPYSTHVRELDGLLWRAMSESPRNVVELTDGVRREPAADGAPDDAEASDRPAKVDPGREELLACLAEHRGSIVDTARALGLSSRFVLYRMLRKHGIDPEAIHGDER